MAKRTRYVLLGGVAVGALLIWFLVGKLREPPPEPIFGPPPMAEQQPQPDMTGTTANATAAPTPPPLAVEHRALVEPPPPEVEAEAKPPEDPVVRLSFVDDLARLTVENYFPAGSHLSAGKKGVLLLSLKTLNMRYGTRLAGLAHESVDLIPARKEIFNYVLNPVVLRLIHAIYADRFVTALSEYAVVAERSFPTEPGKTRTRLLNNAEVKEMYGLASDLAQELGACLGSLAKMEDLAVRVEIYQGSIKAALNANEHFRKALNRYQELRPSADQPGRLSPDAREQLDMARTEMEESGEEYGQALGRRERLKASLVGRIKRDSGIHTLPEGEILYAAQWVYRRLQENPGHREAIATASLMLKELSTSLEDHVQ